MAVMTRSQRRTTAEAMTESPSNVLTEDLMIEILSRVESNNPLELRRVCKLWNSLILDPQFVKNHSRRSFTEDIYVLYIKVREHLKAFLSHISKNPMVPPEEEDNDDDEDEEEEDNVADTDEEEEDEKDEDKDASAEKGTWKHWLMNLIGLLENMLVEIRLLKKDLKTIKAQLDTQLVQEEAEEVAQLDNLWVAVRYINIKTYRANMQILEDRVNSQVSQNLSADLSQVSNIFILSPLIIIGFVLKC